MCIMGDTQMVNPTWTLQKNYFSHGSIFHVNEIHSRLVSNAWFSKRKNRIILRGTK